MPFPEGLSREKITKVYLKVPAKQTVPGDDPVNPLSPDVQTYLKNQISALHALAMLKTKSARRRLREFHNQRKLRKQGALHLN